MGKVTPILERIYRNCESIAVLENVERSARAKRMRLKAENEKLEWYNADKKFRGKVVPLDAYRNRLRHQVTYQPTTNQAA